ncbi:sacsin N-terminal ATP-binding-like domain-containing protein [Streptomyces calidiresistens]
MLDAWAASPARFREDANAEEDLARGGYRDRVVIELAQNAADAAARAGVPGRLRLTLRDGLLTAANTGAPLDAAGVESLSTLRASAKRDEPAEGRVGRFGVGFSAVLAVTDTPVVRGRAGGVRWSLTEAVALAGDAADRSGGLAAELARRAGSRHAVPLLRLPLPAPARADVGDDPAGWETVVELPLRDAAASDLADRLLAAVDDALLLALPGLTEIVVERPAGRRRLIRSVDPDDPAVVVIRDGDRTTAWRTASAAGEAGPDLLADRPLEERERPHWSVTWAVPVGADGSPAAPRGPGVVHAPTPTDEPLGIPGVLLASFPLEPTRRHVAPGPLTDFLIDRAAETLARLIADWRPVGPGTLDLVPGPLGGGALDTALRERLLALLPEVPFLPPALPPGPSAPDPTGAPAEADAAGTDGDTPRALRPSRAELVEGAGARTVAVLADLFPNLLPAGLEHRPALRLLGVSRIPLGEAIDRVAAADRPPSWWHNLYDALAGTDPDLLTGLPVPLADGRPAIGPRGVLLPLPAGDTRPGDGHGPGDPDPGTGPVPARLARLGLRVAHPGAVHPLLEKLGAVPATPRAVLETPRVRAAVAASMEDDPLGDPLADPLDGDDGDAAGPLRAPELADIVLDLVRAAGIEPGELPWLAALALPDEDAEPTPAGELVLPGSPFHAVIRDGELPLCDPELVERWGEGPLAAVGVQARFALHRAEDVVLDPDELVPEDRRDPGYPEPDDLGLLDAVDVWCEDALDDLPDTPLPPVAGEVMGVRDLELVDDDRWPLALAQLSEPPLRDALTRPVRVRMPDGTVETTRPYTAWWLRGAPVLGGRRPAGLRTPDGDPLLIDLYDTVDAGHTAGVDERVLRALGVRTTAAALLDEPGGAAELLSRLADPDREVDPTRLHGLYTLLAELDPEEVTLPDELRAVVLGDGAGGDTGARSVVVPAGEALVADAPDLLPLAAGRPLLPCDPRRAAALGVLLEVPLLGTALAGGAAVPADAGEEREVPAAARALLGPDTPDRYREHEELVVAGVELDWRLCDGVVHAATVEGLAAGLARAAGRWSRRFELAALLEDPSRTAELSVARWFD